MYTPLLLSLLGLLGILLHNLSELNKQNRVTKGNINFVKYFKMEIYSILISLIMVIAAVIVSQEIAQLENVGKWLGLGFITIGYTGQSLLLKLKSSISEKFGIKDNMSTTESAPSDNKI